MKVRDEVAQGLRAYAQRENVGFEYKTLQGRIVKGLCNYRLQHVLLHELGFKGVSLYDVWDFRAAGFEVLDDVVLTATDSVRPRNRRTRIVVLKS